MQNETSRGPLSAEEKREKKLAYMREWRRRKIAEDPTFLEREAKRTLAHHRLYPEKARARRKARLANDPACERRYHEAWREQNRERVRETARQINRRRYEKIREYLKSPQQAEKQAARRALHSAIRAGRITKPKQCQDCGDTPLPRRLHAHHADYAKPFDVEWLCSICHGKRSKHD